MSERILLDHGGGGLAMQALINDEILPRLGSARLGQLPDAASLNARGPLLFSTDSYVVQPMFFPGGNIGDLAVHGTVNDIAVSGGMPRWLSLALILEEGLPRADLHRVLDSIGRAARACQIEIVTGDTKVVPHGQCDGLYANTAGIGEALPGFVLGSGRLRAGDKVVVSGTLGDHGMAVMCARHGFELAGNLRSDTAPVHRLVACLGDVADSVHFMRDPTRGGLSAVLADAVTGSKHGLRISESALPFCDDALGVAEALGIDLLHVASEGRAVLICAAERADDIVQRWRNMPEGKGATIIGEVIADKERVILETVIGGRRLLDVPTGELLPRIC